MDVVIVVYFLVEMFLKVKPTLYMYIHIILLFSLNFQILILNRSIKCFVFNQSDDSFRGVLTPRLIFAKFFQHCGFHNHNYHSDSNRVLLPQIGLE